MDKQLLDALSNLSVALEKISDALDKDKNNAQSAVGTALQSGDFSEQLKEIDKGIKSIKTDTGKILDNQDTIIQLQKQKSEEKSLFGTSEKGGSKEALKKGIGMIVLIAGAILAIGFAFKLIGDVDFASVLALSLSLPMIAYSFEKIAAMELDYTSALSIFGIITSMSLSLVASSYILSAVATLGVGQLITVVAIAGAFSLMSFSLGKMITGFKDIAPADALKASWLMPIVLLGVSIAIAGSSYILAQTAPIGLAQAFSVVVIAAAFGAISYGLGNLIGAFGSISAADAVVASILMPLVLVGISYAIVESSKILQNVQWIGLPAAISAILVAGVFFAISYSIKPLMKGIQGVKVLDMFKGAAMMVMMSGAIVASSFLIAKMPIIPLMQILKFGLLGLAISLVTFPMIMALKSLKSVSFRDVISGSVSIVVISAAIAVSSYAVGMMLPIDIGTIFSFTALSIGLAISSIFMAASLYVLSKLGTIKDYLMGGLAVVLIAGVVAASSQLLSLGDYSNHPSLDWVIGSGLSIFGFGLMTLGVGLLITLTGGLAAGAMALGGVAVLSISALIVGVDSILASGTYSKFPDESWAKGVGGSLLAFSMAVIALGVINSGGGLLETLTFGAVENPIDAGIEATLKVATLFPIIDAIVSSGSYTKYPSLSWSEHISSILGKFSSMSLGNLLGSVFGASPVDVARQILTIDNIFSMGGYKVYPKVKWVDGTLMALYDYSKMTSSKYITGFTPGILDKIALDILKVDKIFSKGEYEDFPNEEWVDGTLMALGKFSDFMASQSMIDIVANLIKDFIGGGLPDLARTVVKVDEILSEGSYNIYPRIGWVNGVTSSLSSFARIMTSQSILGVMGNKIKELFGGGLDKIALGIVKIDAIFSTGKFSKYPSEAWSQGILLTMQNYNKMTSLLGDTFKGGDSAFKPLKNIVSSITMLATAFDKLSKSFGNFNNTISTMDADKLTAIRSMSSSIVLLSLSDPEQFDKIMSGLEDKSGVLSQLVNDFESQKEESSGSSGSAIHIAPSQTENTDIKELSTKVDQMTAILADISSVVGSRGSLKTYLNSIKENQLDSTTYRSDKRLKNIIRKVGVSDNGINIYDFTYRMDNTKIYRGVIAQELLGTEHENVVSESNGFWCVDYSKIDVDFSSVETL